LNLPPRAETTEYLIGPGDLLSIQVWEQDKMSTKGRVRVDGRMSIPFLHDVTVAGKTPSAVARELQEALKPYVLVPVVNVVVEEPQAQTVSVLGQVGRPGQYVMGREAGVAQVLAAAGGLSPFAHKDRIFVLRDMGQGRQRIRLRYESLVEASSAAAKFRVQGGDVVVVE
jgi:polysaccharide export outer membrane protein